MRKTRPPAGPLTRVTARDTRPVLDAVLQSQAIVCVAVAETPLFGSYGRAVFSHRFTPSAFSRKIRDEPKYWQST